MSREVLVPSVRLPVAKEVLYENVRDTYRNIAGMVALHQQFYFSSLEVFQKIAETAEESIVRIVALNPEKQKNLKDKLSLFGITRLDILLNPGTVELKYPKYDALLEYRDVGMYNVVRIENPPERPITVVRIEKKGDSAPELFFVRKKDSWSMKDWSEVLLYGDIALFEKRINVLLPFFGILREDFDYAVSSLNELTMGC
jgi:hypothetical protein